MIKELLLEPLPDLSQSEIYVTDCERERGRGFGEVRRREYYGWRAVVRRHLGAVEIDYNASGAPFFPNNPNLYLSVSHGAGRVAVCLSESACCVDVESLDRRFDRIADRFFTPSERLLNEDPRLAATVWSAKECLYKLVGREGLDWCNDLRVTAVGDGWIEGRVCDSDPIRLSLRYLNDAVVVWAF